MGCHLSLLSAAAVGRQSLRHPEEGKPSRQLRAILLNRVAITLNSHDFAVLVSFCIDNMIYPKSNKGHLFLLNYIIALWFGFSRDEIVKLRCKGFLK